MKNSIILTMVMSALLLTACGGGSSDVDKFLDSYESSIDGFEDMAKKGSVSLSDITEMNQKNLELVEKANELESEGEWSGSQEIRYLKLTSRFSDAMMKMSQSMQQ